MKWRQTLLWSALALMSVQAHAVVVDLTFDVTTTERYTETLLDGVRERTTLETGPLATFAFNVRFDTSHPWNLGSPTTFFMEGGEATETPHTGEVRPLMPEQDAPFAQAMFSRDAQDPSLPSTQSQPTTELIYVGAGFSVMDNSTDSLLRIRSYVRGVQWLQPGQQAVPLQLTAPDEADILRWLEGLKGLPLAGAFQETVTDATFALPDMPGLFTTTRSTSTGVVGDAVLRGMTLTPVPEPSTLALSVLGLAGIAAVCRRRAASA